MRENDKIVVVKNIFDGIGSCCVHACDNTRQTNENAITSNINKPFLINGYALVQSGNEVKEGEEKRDFDMNLTYIQV